ncbi:MAG: hypothetical protein ABR499_19705 [Gemmatimonadaceae bacterium]
MTDETREEAGVDEAPRDAADVTMPPDVAPAPRRRRWRKWPWILFGVFVMLPVLLLTAWTAITLNWDYSRGTRTGYVQKFSKKGWLCKTWEGEIAMVNMPGAAQERFAFTVRNDSIAALIDRYQGQRVVIEYEEHKGIPTRCFGETQYFVKGVRALGL